MRKLLPFILIVFGTGLAGCVGMGQDGTPYQNTYKALSVSKHTAVFIASTAKDLHFNGVISDLQLSTIKDAYERVQRSQDILIDAQNEALQYADDPDKQKRVAALTSVYTRTMTEFVTLAIDIGLIDEGDERIGVRRRPIPSQ